MKLFFAIALVLVFFANHCSGFSCEEENFFDVTTYKQCPGPLDKPTDRYCCGTKQSRYCCDTPFGINEEDLEKFAEHLPTILGIVFTIAISLIILCIVCCCCCPFCLLHKRRQRGVVHNPAPGVTQMQVTSTPAPVSGQQGYIPVQTAAPQPYPPQQYAAPPQGYAPPPTGAPYPTSVAPYPTSGAPYPTQPPTNDNPPPYVEKQMPFNPNY